MVMVLLGRTNWSMLFVYWAAQYLGGIAGAGIVYGVYFGRYTYSFYNTITITVSQKML